MRISHRIFNLDVLFELDVEGVPSGGGLLLQLDERKIEEESAVLKLTAKRKDGRPFILKGLTCSLQVPIIDIQGLWSPGCDQHDLRSLPWLYEKTTAANALMPVVAFLNRSGQNRLTAGLLEQTLETKVTVRLDESRAVFNLSFRRPPEGIQLKTSEWREYLYLSRKPCDWFSTVEDYVRIKDRILPQSFARIPQSAYEPVYCSWYAIHHEVNQSWVIQQARLARELGFGTFIIDDGWFFPGKGEWGKYRFCGDWRVETSKFPDMRGMVEELHDMGMKVLLWIAPFMVGLQSQAYHQWGPYLMKGGTWEDRLEVRNLCPRNKKVHDHLVETLARLMEDHGLDGFKIDFVDFVSREPCQGDHPHDFASLGEGMDACMRAVYEHLRRIDPEVLVEFRQSYANLAGRSYATMFRSGDAPADYDTNRWRVLLLRSFSAGIPVHFDPAYWHFEDHIENVARHLISSVFAVPMLSMDLARIPPAHAHLIKKWMQFYHDNKRVLNHGEFEPIFNDGRIVAVRVIGDSRGVIGVFEDVQEGVDLPKGVQEAFVLNASNRPRLVLGPSVTGRCEIFNRRFEKVSTRKIAGVDVHRVDVEIGGLVRIRKGDSQ